MIHSLGLQKYYQKREWSEEAMQAAGLTTTEEVFPAEAYTTENEPGSCRLEVRLEGIHCPSCIWLIESALNAQPGVKAARVNFTTRKLTLLWQGAKGESTRLISLVQRLGYRPLPYDSNGANNALNREARFLLWCLAIAGFSSGNLMLLSVSLWTTSQELMGVATRDFLNWVSALITLPTLYYAGRPFFRSAWSALRTGRTNMDVPVSVGVILATVMSLWETFRHGEHAYFDSVVTLLFFLLIGRYLDVRARGKAFQASQDLAMQLTGTATVLETDGSQRVIPVREVKEGMVLQVAMGEKIPADGVLREGETQIDTRLITGETLPRSANVGDAVFAGTVNLAAPVTLTVKQGGENSLLACIVRQMEEAENRHSYYVRLADKVAHYYTPVVHVLGLLTFLGWWLGTGMAWQIALMRGVTVLIITCPCALGLAVPVVQVLASGRLMRQGIFLKSGDALEKLASITDVVLDKTGTLTLGAPQLQHAETITAESFQLAASLAAHSRHPLARSLAAQWQGEFLPLEEIQEIPGKGMQARYQEMELKLGSRLWCDASVAKTNEDSSMELWLSVQKANQPSPLLQRFAFTDTLRMDSPAICLALQQQGLALHLLSGDREEVVKEVARQVQISDYHAAYSPEQKYQEIVAMQQMPDKKILMVGDGLNDAPALKAADVSISPSSGMDISQNAADIVFTGEKLAPVQTVWRMARIARKRIHENLWISMGYNVIAVPLAVMGYVTPLVAAVAMSASSLVVVANAFRLRNNS
jgi:Cu2+-exporting ATPase